MRDVDMIHIPSSQGYHVVCSETQRPLCDPFSSQYNKKFKTIVLPSSEQPRSPNILPDIIDCIDPQSSILRKTKGDIAELFYNGDLLYSRGLDDDFTRFFFTVHFHKIYSKSEQANRFMRKYFAAISQTGLKGEMLRQKLLAYDTPVDNREDEFDMLWEEQLEATFLRKTSDEGIHTQYQHIVRSLHDTPLLTKELVHQTIRRWENIDFGDDGLISRQVGLS